MSRLVNASLHRFGDRVAISLPGKPIEGMIAPK